MSEATAAAPAPSAPSGGAPPPSAPSGAGSSAPTQQPTMSDASSQSASSSTPARAPMLIKHRHVAKDPTGADVESELELDIAEHVFNAKHKIKSDGEERELTTAELLERAPLADGAFRRMREAREAIKERDGIKQQVERLGERLKDPKGAREVLMRTLGGPEQYRAFLEQGVADLIAEERMTPAQREQRARETDTERRFREREEAISRKERAFQEQQQAVHQREVAALRERHAKEWPGHLERAGIKATPHAIRLMANIMRDAMENRFTMTEEQAAREVAKEYGEHLGAQGKRLPAQRDEEIARLDAQPGRVALPRTPGGQFAAPPKPPQSFATLEEYKSYQREVAEADYQRRMAKR